MVRGYADVESRKAMAVENLNRKDLEPLEAAATYQELLDLGIANEGVAALAGTSAQQVSDHTSLLSLPRKVRRELAGGAIDYAAALLLAQLADMPERLTRALHNARNGWSLTSAVQHELHERELERKTESSRAELEKRGVPIIERPRDSFAARKIRAWATAGGASHSRRRSTPGRRATRHISRSTPETSSSCASTCSAMSKSCRASRPPPMRRPSVLPNAASVRRSDGRSQNAVRCSRGTCRASMTRPLRTTTHSASRCSMWEAVASVACELLGQTNGGDRYHGHARSLTARVAANPGELAQVALAVAMGRAEVYSGREYISPDQRALVAEHLRYLVGLGYQPTEVELDMIRERTAPRRGRHQRLPRP